VSAAVVTTRAARPAAMRTSTPGTAVAWVPERDLDLAEWSRAGQRLGVMNRCSPWWLGDWIRYGNSKFGEKYSRASAITGYDRQTLMNMVYVASRFEFSRRRENLSWSHHEVVAGLPPTEQDQWLDRAVAERWTRADLRLELRAHQGQRDRPLKLEDGVAGAEADQQASIACPRCGHQIRTSELAPRPDASPASVGSLPVGNEDRERIDGP
jgi:hypothetical protein